MNRAKSQNMLFAKLESILKISTLLTWYSWTLIAATLPYWFDMMYDERWNMFTCSKPWWCSQTPLAQPYPKASIARPPHSHWPWKWWHFVGWGKPPLNLPIPPVGWPQLLYFMVKNLPCHRDVWASVPLSALPNSLLKKIDSNGLLVLGCEDPLAVLLDHWRFSYGTVTHNHHLGGREGNNH